MSMCHFSPTSSFLLCFCTACLAIVSSFFLAFISTFVIHTSSIVFDFNLNMGRGATWIAKECRVLAETWISISEDPVKGSDQDAVEFWDAVCELFNKERPRAGDKYARENTAFMRQWAKIRAAVSKFAGCFKAVKELDESGKTIEDLIEDALKLFEAENHDSDSHETLECWRVLRDKPKWRDLEGAKQMSRHASPFRFITKDSPAFRCQRRHHHLNQTMSQQTHRRCRTHRNRGPCLTRISRMTI